MKAKNKVGRPMKFAEETKVISFRVPKKNKKLIKEIKDWMELKLYSHASK